MEEKKSEEILEKEATEDTSVEQSAKEETLENSEVVPKDNGRYETLLELPSNLWTYGSPVLFTSGILERDTISKKNRLTLKFVNIYLQDIREVHISIILGLDEEAEVIQHSYLALGQKYLVEKGRTAKIAIADEEARDFQIRIDRVVFEDGSVWNKKDAVLESAGEMEEIETFAEAKLKDYEDNYVSAVQAYEKDESESIGNSMEIFKRIRWYKDSAELYHDAKRKYGILKQNEERRRAGASKRENRKKAMRVRYIKISLMAVVLVLMIAALYVAYIVPNRKLSQAKKQLEKEQYGKAATNLENLHGFKDSETYLAASYYNIAKEAYEKGDTAKAKTNFEKSFEADEKSDEGQWSKAYLNYFDGVEAMEKEDYENAQKLLQKSKDSIGDYNLVNDINVRLSEIYYRQGDLESAWNSIVNLYAKNTDNEEIANMYCTYGEAYAKKLLTDGKRVEGMDVYGKVKADKHYAGAALTKDFYTEAVALAQKGKVDEAVAILKDIKGQSDEAAKLYNEITAFQEKTQYWVGTWIHKVKGSEEKKYYTIKISTILYQGEMCLKINDQNNKRLSFDTIISSKNRVTQISIGQYMMKFKLKKFYDQKFTYTLMEGGKMERKLRYAGETYKTKYRRKK
ncbi:MAG: hypothetical protein K6G64_03300 [Eubacterium sp.]|nr:hypothetical protein [Eubacterium sp.]